MGNHRQQGILPKIFLSLFFFLCTIPAFAASTITFLNTDTQLADHRVGRVMLSALLAQQETLCLTSSGGHGKPHHHGKGHDNGHGKGKKTAKDAYKCLEKAITDLYQQRKLSKAEKKVLLKIIKDAKNGTDNPDPQPSLSTVNGRITAPDGSAIVGARVVATGTAGNVQATSDATGRFSLQLTPNSNYVLQLSVDGFADQGRLIKSPSTDGIVTIDIDMLRRLPVGSFLAGANEEINLPGEEGASVRVIKNAFVDSAGNPVTGGNIDVSITPVDVSNPAILSTFPGEFSGIPEGSSTASPIISLGTAEFKFTQNGQPLQLAPGATARIQIPVYITQYQDGSPVHVGDSIPLWWLNEATSIWEQEGTGTVVASAASPTGLAMEATVSHFSWWNCDVSMNAAQATVTVFSNNPGTALIRAQTSADLGWRPNSVETTAPLGTPVGPLYIPSNVEVCFSADISYNNGNTAISDQQCVTAASNASVQILLAEPLPGPLNIMAYTSTATNPATVNGYQNFPLQRISIIPTTLESAVSYSITSGTLPTGISLSTVNGVKAELSGVPTVAGDFPLEITGQTADGETSVIALTLSISQQQPPPQLPISALLYVPSSVTMANFNSGGAAESWSISNISDASANFSLDTSTGILVLAPSTLPVSWTATITATNASGSSDMAIRVLSGGVVAQ